MKKFPCLSQHQALVLLRISTALVFFLHALVRVINGTTPRFGEFMESKGFPSGVGFVWAITTFELIGGVLLALGYFRKILSLGFIIILVTGIILIHAQLGWFVGEHGTGGTEYSFILIMALLAIAATEKQTATAAGSNL